MSVNTSIGLNDGMSPVFRQIYEAMRPAIEAMERMQEMVGMNVEPEFVNEARNRVEDLHNLIESVDPELEVSANADGLDGAKEAIQTMTEQLEAVTNIPPPNTDDLISGIGMVNEEFASLQRQIEETTDPIRAEHLRESLARLRDELGLTTDATETLGITMGPIVDAIDDATGAMDEMLDTTESLGERMQDNGRHQQEFNEEIDNGNGFFRNMLNNVSNLSAMLSGLAIVGIINQVRTFFQQNVAIADQFTSMDAQILRMAGSLEYANRLQDMIFASAQRTNTAFLETVGVVTRLNATVGDMFADHQSLVAFTETFQQSISASATSAYNAERAMQAMESAMASGVLKARDFNRLMAYSPVAVQAVADYLGVTMMQMQKIADEGYITADVFASAMLNSIDEINEKAGTIPTTWSDHMNNMQNSTLRAFQPLMTAFSDFINTNEFGMLIDAWTNGIKFFAAITTGIFHIIAWGITAVAPIVDWFSNLVMNNLDWILFGLMAVGIGLLVLGAKWLFAGGAAQIATSTMIAGLMKVLIPLMKILVPILIFLQLMDLMGITVADVLAFVGGLFGALFAFLFNQFVLFWNIIASVAEFLVNVWNHPAYATQRLFYNLVSNVLNLFGSFADGAAGAANTLGDVFVDGANIAIRAVNELIKLLNMLPGVGIATVGEVGSASALDGVGDRIRGLASGLAPEQTPDDFWEAPRLDFANPAEWAGNAANWTRGAVGSVGDMFDNVFGGIFDTDFGDLGDFGDLAGLDQDFLDMLGSIGDGIDGTNDRLGNGIGPGREIGNIGSINDEVKISEEDIRMMRDIAERDFIINYQQLSPEISITVNNNGDEVDIEDLVEQIEDMLEEQQASALVTS